MHRNVYVKLCIIFVHIEKYTNTVYEYILVLSTLNASLQTQLYVTLSKYNININVYILPYQHTTLCAESEISFGNML